jgi:DNA-binding NarL/FixJ family response regulator
VTMVTCRDVMNLMSNAELTPRPPSRPGSGDTTASSEPLTPALPRLLIADDDPLVRSVVTAQLATHFDVVAVAVDAQDAIDLACGHRPDVALIDVRMPAGGGLRATAEIYQHAPETTIVAFSGDESERGVSEMLSAGATAYVRKGVSPQELAQKLMLCIETRAAEPAIDPPRQTPDALDS